MTNDIDAIVEEVRRLYPAVYRRFHVSRQHVAGADVTPRMVAIMHHLSSAGPLTLGELRLHLRASKSAATELVDRLEAKGYVERMRDERDARRVFVWLTAAGRRSAARFAEVLGDESLREAVAAMTASERTALVRGLRALLRKEDSP